MQPQPLYLLFVQHGWNDDHRNMQQLAASLATPDTQVYTPNLGIFQTWFAIEPLIDQVEQQLDTAKEWHPQAQLRIVGHSLGGLVWLEVLHRRRELWTRVQSVVLLGSPVGGSDLARIFDPFGIVPSIARDLGKNRRALAEEIARALPVLVIVGDSDGGSDQVITVGSTRVEGALTVRLSASSHNALRTPQVVAGIIRKFWGNAPVDTIVAQLIQRLQAVPGMTDAHERDFVRARTVATFVDGTTLRTWKNPVGVDHVFVADPVGSLRWGGFVGWVHARALHICLAELANEYGAIKS